jgi:hypothetical protein
VVEEALDRLDLVFQSCLCVVVIIAASCDGGATSAFGADTLNSAIDVE